jgi:histidyl-tRNA synthetase
VDIRAVSGFPEWLPSVRLVEQRFLDTIRDGFEKFGFAPIETPAVERLEVLDAKGGVGRQIFKVTRPAMEEQAEGANLGLHFDLTVPLARYVVQHAHELTFPFRRYQMQKVWRGERAQRGRFREFYQCDIDVIGRGSLDLLYDAEIPCVISEVFRTLGLPDFNIHVSNRKVLTSFFSAIGASQHEQALLRIVDRYHKADEDELAQAMANQGVSVESARSILALAGAGSVDEAASILSEAGADMSGADDLRTVVDSAIQLGMRRDQLRVDCSIARGLDYYTGTVFETFVRGRESWGSICSGGRYDDLAAYFGSEVAYPGVGISIGLTRLIDLLQADTMLGELPSSPASVLVTTMQRDKYLPSYLSLARDLRAAGLSTDIYLEQDRIQDQLSYASQKGIPIALIMGDRESESGRVNIRDLRSREQREVELTAVVAEVARMLS